MLALATLGPVCLDAAEVQFDKHRFTLPDGFTIERIAGPPLADRPITADFDEAGFLYVTDSSGSNEPTQKQAETKPHRVVRLEDTDGDGRFDKSQVFADRLMFPEGSMWFQGSLYVAAPPSIWKLTDTDGDGLADQRKEWFQGKTLTGCANDLHGPYRGPDGWIYWAKGAFAEQTHPRPGKTPLVTKAAHIFRARPDGSGIESVMTGGMDNPVDVVFTPGGERIFTTTFFQHPGGGQRDGLIHAIYGGLYGKPHNVLDSHPHTGDLMPVLTHLGPAAPCGLNRYESSAFGPEYQNNLFACNFNLHKITRHILVPNGPTFQTKDQDFLVSDHVDFHPTDIIEDADGSLIVVDTGGWYKLCCPTSQLYKPDVLGAIYRVRRTGSNPISDPRGLKLDWAKAKPAELARRLGDARPAVQQRAMAQLAEPDAKATAPLKKSLRPSAPAQARLNAVWTLARISTPEARALTRLALADPDDTVRLAAVHSTGLWRDADARPALESLLRSGALPLCRAAAEALGRIGSDAAVPALLKAATRSDDPALDAPARRVLEHAFTFALIEIAAPNPTAAGLQANHPLSRKAALIALDQMAPQSHLKPEQVTPLLTSTNPVLQQTASWLVNRHPDWAGTLKEFFTARLVAPNLADRERAELARQLARFARNAQIQQLLAHSAAEPDSKTQARLSALDAMAQTDLKELPKPWTDVVLALLESRKTNLLPKAIAILRATPPPAASAEPIAAALLAIARSESLDSDLRVASLAASPLPLKNPEDSLFQFLQSQVTASRPVAVRVNAARVLSRATLSEPQLLALADSLKDVGPMEITPLLSAFSKNATDPVGLKLIAVLGETAARSALRAEVLRPHFTNFTAAVQQQAATLLASLDVDVTQQKAHLEELLTAMPTGDVRRGQAVFNSTKTACATCHAIGYLGGNTGPDLTRIGQIRTERDLLESIIYPSASLVRSYEPIVVSTRSGEPANGILRQDTAEEILLATGPALETRIPRDQITDIRPGTLSIMPDGMEEALSRQELADLVAFLKATKW